MYLQKYSLQPLGCPFEHKYTHMLKWPYLTRHQCVLGLRRACVRFRNFPAQESSIAMIAHAFLGVPGLETKPPS